MLGLKIVIDMRFEMFKIYACWVYPQVEATLGAYLKLNLETCQANIFLKNQLKTCILE